MLPSREEMNRALRRRAGGELRDRFAGATAAVCGLGGLGSNIAVSLARAGVGTLLLFDFDRVDVSNLNRQQYKAAQVGMEKALALAENLREISPYTALRPHVVRLTEENVPELLAEAQVICEAFDRPEEKSMLVNAVLEKLPDAYLVAASGMAGLGSANSIRTRRVAGRFYLCGDGVSAVSEETGLFSTRAALCAAHQAHMVLRILAGEFDV